MQTAATNTNASSNAAPALSLFGWINALLAKLVLITVVLHAHSERDECLT